MTTIVTVEDSGSIRRKMIADLNDLGYEDVEDFSTVEDFFNWFRDQSFEDGPPVDVILMDWVLPGMNGLQAIRNLRKDYEVSRLPILVVTSNDEPGELHEAFEAGCTDYLKKPVEPVELKARIMNALRLKDTTEKLNSTNKELEEANQTLERRMGKIREAFEQYVPKSVSERAMEGSNPLKLGGDEREITVLYADLCNFTGYSQRHSAADVAGELNELLTTMTECVFDHEGILDKYIGDALVAEFGVLSQYETGNKSKRACKAYLEISDKLADRQEASGDDQSLELRVGISTGQAVVGNMGSEMLFDFTAIGDTMNRGARLEQANKRFGSACLIDEPTYNDISDDIAGRKIGWIEFGSDASAVPVYEPFGYRDSLSEDEIQVIETFEEGLSLFQAQEWLEAKDEFEKVLALYKNDKPSDYYLKKIDAFLRDELADDWIPTEVF